MESSESSLLHLLVPGSLVQGDWFTKKIPSNIEAGENTQLDSSHCFKNFFSKLPVGLKIGSNCTLFRTSIATEENGMVEIGNDCYLANAAVVATEKISIGNRVFIAGGVTIVDSDFHPISPAARLADTIALSPIGNYDKRPRISSKPVVVEDDVWIGFNATLLKGIRVGAGAVIMPGSVVTQDVLPHTTVTGNPATQHNLTA
ncbi:MAG: acyltransferase [Chitinophagaceae bacterium]|nr:MAG: acyltransferase [Chitinophagaceae bacterium]